MGVDRPGYRCRWVRDRLPLLAGGELTGADRRKVERHLIACPDCRRHERSLAGALGVLQAAAARPAGGPPRPRRSGPPWRGRSASRGTSPPSRLDRLARFLRPPARLRPAPGAGRGALGRGPGAWPGRSAWARRRVADRRAPRSPSRLGPGRSSPTTSTRTSAVPPVAPARSSSNRRPPARSRSVRDDAAGSPRPTAPPPGSTTTSTTAPRWAPTRSTSRRRTDRLRRSRRTADRSRARPSAPPLRPESS